MELDGLDALHAALDETFDSGELTDGHTSSQPTGRDDPMDMALNLTLYEQARASGPAAEARALQSGDTVMAAAALEDFEDITYYDALTEHGIPDELHDDEQFNAYVVDAEGDIDEAARRWDENIDNQYAQEEAEVQADIDEAMATVVGALENGEVDWYSLPPELQQAAIEWVGDQEISVDEQIADDSERAMISRNADMIEGYSGIIQQEAGAVGVSLFEHLLELGYDIEESANAAMQVAQDGLRGEDGMNVAQDGFAADMDAYQ
jgi:hypothetical protein